MLDRLLPFWCVLPVICVAGGAVLWALTRRVTHDAGVARLVLSSYVLRIALAVGLFAMSYWHWPILQSLQSPGGFWAFGPDSSTYHIFSQHFVKAWHLGIDFPNPYVELEYIALIGGIYFFLGAHALYPIVLNCWCAACSGLLAYVIGRRIADHRAGLLGSILVGFWPSTFIWSSQLLKDSLCIFLVLAALALLLQIVTTIGQPSWLQKVALYAGLGVVIVAMTRFRFYLGVVLSCVTLAVLAWPAVSAFMQRRSRHGWQYVMLMMCVVFSMLFARTINMSRLLGPRYPELGRWKLAMQYWQQQDWPNARLHFEKAVWLNHKFTVGYLGFAAINMIEGHREDALLNYVDLLKYEQNVERRRFIGYLTMELRRHVIAEVKAANRGAMAWDNSTYLTFGTVHLLAGQLRDAIEDYQNFMGREPNPTKRQTGHSIIADIKSKIAEHERPEHAGYVWVTDAMAPHDGVLQFSLDILRSMRLSAAPAQVEQLPPLDVSDIEYIAQALVHDSEGPVAIGNETRTPIGRVVPIDKVNTVATSLLPARLAPNATGASQPGYLIQAPAPMIAQIGETLQSMSPQSLSVYRRGFVGDGGHAQIDARAQISTPWQVIRYLPRALALGLLAPFPWQWFDTRGSTGAMRIFAGCEMGIMYLLYPGICIGLWRLLRRRQLEDLVVMAFILLLAMPLSLVISNMGILFRLRLQFLLPLLIVGAVGGGVRCYQDWWRHLRRRWLPGAHDQVQRVAAQVSADVRI